MCIGVVMNFVLHKRGDAHLVGGVLAVSIKMQTHPRSASSKGVLAFGASDELKLERADVRGDGRFRSNGHVHCHPFRYKACEQSYKQASADTP